MAGWRDWEKVYERFDVNEPAREARWRVRRPDQRLDRLRQSLSVPFAKKKVLLLGTQGSGKTTELYGLMANLPERRIAVYLDVAEHVRRKSGDERVVDRMAPWEVVFLAGLAVWRVARDLGFADDAQGLALGEAASRLQPPLPDAPQVDAAKLARAMTIGLAAGAGAVAQLPGLADAGVAAGALQFLGEVVGAGEWRWPIGRGAPRDDTEQHAQKLVEAVNDLFARVRKEQFSFVVVIDGLDRQRDPDSTRRLFLESTLLGQLDAFTVACGPVALSRRARLGQLATWEPAILPELSVFAHGAPRQPAGQLQFFRDLWAVRTRDLDVRVEPAALDRLAWASGGRVREFVRLVQNLALEAYRLEGVTATVAMADELIAEARQNFATGFNRGHDEVLCAVRDDPAHRMPDALPRPDGSTLVDELLNNFWLLPYRNGDEWFHPHPLLLDRLTPPSAS